MSNDERILPDHPLEFIRKCVRERKIRWTYHVNMRLKDRFIPREFIIDFVDSYEIIEEFPEINTFQVISSIRTIRIVYSIFYLLPMSKKIMFESLLLIIQILMSGKRI